MESKVDTTGMVLIKDSRFMMGSERGVRFSDEHPRHEVRVTDYYMDRTEFSNGDLQRVVQRYAQKFDLYSIPCGQGRPSLIASGDNAAALWNAHKGEVDFQTTCGLEIRPSLAVELPQSPVGFDGPHQPLVNVSWDQADWLCRVQGKRLPTEAEWEKAAIGPSKGYNPEIECGTESGKCTTDEIVFRTSQTANVCSKGEKGWGLCDMHGNAWEWVSDWYDADYYERSPSMNPTGPKTGINKVLRGGSWRYDSADYVRAAARSGFRPYGRYGYVGFRCAVSREGP